MTFVLLIPGILSLLMLAAHFFRAGWMVLVGISLGAIVLLFVRRSWSMRIVQVLLFLGALEWLRSMSLFVGERAADGLPWTRLAVILGSVASFTAFSAILFETRRLRNCYRAT